MEAIKTLATRGFKAEVWNGSALKTAGGLTKADLVLSKKGKPVSIKRQSEAAAERYPAMIEAMIAKRVKPS